MTEEKAVYKIDAGTAEPAVKLKGLRCTAEIIMGGASSNKFTFDANTKGWLFGSIGVVVETKGSKWLIPWNLIQRAELG